MDRLLKTWFIIAQISTIPVNFVISTLLKLKVERPSDLRLTKGMLVIANHQSKIDPFLISNHIGIKNLRFVLPIRYPVTPDFMSRTFLGFFISLLGGYNVGRNTMERLQKLIYTRNLIKKGYSIVLFPEGKIVPDVNIVTDFKKGANMLFNENYPVVFVRLIGLNNEHKFHFWKNNNTKLIYSKLYGSEVSKEEKIEAMIIFFDKNHN